MSAHPCTYPDCLDTGGRCTDRYCRAGHPRDARLEAENAKLKTKNGELQDLVEKAYHEGWRDGRHGGNPYELWLDSNTNGELEATIELPPSNWSTATDEPPR